MSHRRPWCIPRCPTGILLLPVLAGCAGRADPPGGAVRPSDPPPAAPETTTPDTIEVPLDPPRVWYAADGWTLLSAGVAEDLDGDHDKEALVAADGPDGPALLVVPGPLRYPRVLPDDALAVLPGATWDGVHGDATGDGAADLVVGWDGGERLLAGPIDGAVDPASGSPVDGSLEDLDDDGVLDRMAADAHTVEVHFGPADRYDGPADLVVDQWSCPALPGWAEPPQVVGDLDGDGIRELVLGTTTAVDCLEWVFSIPTEPVVHPGDDPGTLRVRRPLQVLKDQTGDGIGDVVVYDLGPRRLVEGPVEAAGGEIASVSGGEVVLPDSALGWFVPAGADLDGDLQADLLAPRSRFPAPPDTVVLRGGAEHLAELAYGGTFDDSPGDPFVEDGVPAMLVTVLGDVRVVDLVPPTR